MKNSLAFAWSCTTFYTLLMGFFMVQTDSYQFAHMTTAIYDLIYNHKVYPVIEGREVSLVAYGAMIKADNGISHVTSQSRACVVWAINYHLLTYTLLVLWAITTLLTIWNILCATFWGIIQSFKKDEKTEKPDVSGMDNC